MRLFDTSLLSVLPLSLLCPAQHAARRARPRERASASGGSCPERYRASHDGRLNAARLVPVCTLRPHARARTDAVHALHQTVSAAEFLIGVAAWRSGRATRAVLAERNVHVAATDELKRALCGMRAASAAAAAVDAAPTPCLARRRWWRSATRGGGHQLCARVSSQPFAPDDDDDYSAVEGRES
ncbi:hypothetical protein KFE25_012659 [Diacronema lutheri]|uniref:Uncharacterized protein n=1 Tax=Diacronema lutheri TaxID=2081491 RepID=A0A8J6C7X1_DIALT|nr:hypothetical protein KFE25_012659 [Diacronema lutheri]